MAGFHFKSTWPNKCETSIRDDNFTPKVSDIETEPHVRCDLSVDDNVHLRVDFNQSEVVSMLSIAFPTYMPTADAVFRFIKSNPTTAAGMLTEIRQHGAVE